MKSPRRLSVAFLTSARAWRGSGVSLAHIAKALLERGHRAHMLAGEAAVLEGFTSRGLKGSRVPTAHTTLEGALAVARQLAAAQAECLVVDRPRDLRLGALASLRYPIRLINRYNLSRPHPPRDVLSRLAYRRVALTIFVSDTSARRALAAGPYMARRPWLVIHEGVGPDFFPDPAAAAAFRSRFSLGARDFVLAVGSLTADKCYPFLFQVVSQAGAPLLVVCGDGPLREQLQEESAAFRTETRFLGMVTPDLLRGAYSAAHCLVHACEIETFGLSVLEAMACACPVIAVAAGAVPEVLGETGTLVAAGDPDQFAGALRGLLAAPDRERVMGLAEQQRAVGVFSLARMQQEHVAAIEAAC